jgi:hypothetical protein
VRSPIRNSNSPPRRGSSPPAGTVVVVRNLTRNTNSEHIKEIFSHYGSVKSVRLDMDERSKLRCFSAPFLFTPLPNAYPLPLTCCSLGTAWVEYSERSSCEAAIDHFDGGQIDGNTVSVKISVKQPIARDVAPPSRRNWGRSSPPRAGFGGGRCVQLSGPTDFVSSITRHTGVELLRLLPVVDRPRAAPGGARRPGGASRRSVTAASSRGCTRCTLKWTCPHLARRRTGERTVENESFIPFSKMLCCKWWGCKKSESSSI